MKKRWNIVGLVLVSCLIVAFSMVAFAEEKEEELQIVRVGVSPYSMYMLFPVAHELNMDKEFGLDFQIKEFTATAPGVQALVRGDVDISANCVAEHISAIQGATEVRNFSGVGFFKGFFFVGRRTQVKPFDELAKEMGLEAAKEFRLKEFKGKSFCVIPQRRPLILDAIAQVGLTEKDVNFLMFADDQKAATAFIGGSGDFYIGSLPQQTRLLQMSDEFVNAGGTEILGPAGMWYDTMVSTDGFMKDNREVALRTLAVQYRAALFFEENPKKFAEIAAKKLAKMTGGEFTLEDYIDFQTNYDLFLTIERSLHWFYNSLSPLYWKYPVEFYINLAIDEGTLKETVSAEEYYGESEKLFYELLGRRDLLEKIYAPFE